MLSSTLRDVPEWSKDTKTSLETLVNQERQSRPQKIIKTLLSFTTAFV